MLRLELGPAAMPLGKQPAVLVRAYPIPVRGITLGRDCTGFPAAPPRPIIAPGIPAPAPPIGIGIIGIPAGRAAPVSSAGLGMPAAPKPDNGELAIRVGVEPCHVGGTDIVPTIRALPRPADVAEPSPPPPNGLVPG